MGCDGGTIPRRDELVRTKKKPEQKDRDAELAAKWKLCALTQEPLQPPIMACQLGRLYNKEALLEFLLDNSKFECSHSFEHLKGLKDVKELKLTENPASDHPRAEKGGAYIDMQTSQYICPISGLEMNGRYKFCVLWPCGCVFADKALKEVKSETCNKCGKPCRPGDIVILNGTDEEIELMRSRKKERELQAKLDKKAKKTQKHKVESTFSSADGPSTSKIPKAETCSSSGKLTNGMEGKKTKLTHDCTLDRKGKQANGKLDDKSKLLSIQSDPTTSAIYKSLFTTSSSAQSRATAHWVTYNPQYY